MFGGNYDLKLGVRGAFHLRYYSTIDQLVHLKGGNWTTTNLLFFCAVYITPDFIWHMVLISMVLIFKF